MASKSIKLVTRTWTTKSGERRDFERWEARYRDEANHEHKRNFKRKVDGQRWLDEQTAAMVTGRYVDPRAGKITFQRFYDGWSQHQIWASNTRENADLAIAGCTFKDMPLKTIRKSHVQAWVKQNSLKLAPSTVKTRFVIVQSVLKAAVADKIIADNPASGVALPRRDSVEAAMVIPTPEEVGLLIEHADQKKRRSTRVGFQAYVALCSFAGLRLGEGIGVKVADIDFLKRQLRVERQLKRAKAEDIERGENLIEATGGMGKPGVQVLVADPKHGSKRTVALPDELLEILSDHVAEYAPGDDPDRWLFADEEGRPWHDNSVTWRWRGTRSAAGLKTRLHDLRHFYASGLIAAGCDVVTVQRAMGHKAATITLNTYSHLWPTAEDKTRDAASGLARQALTGRKPAANESADAG